MAAKSFFYDGYRCPVCEKLFEASDDIVTCPDCGAPHHRECWKQHGHCFYESTHGTEEQWSREKAERQQQDDYPKQNRCPNCGRDNPPYAEFCAGCGWHLDVEDWSIPFRDEAPDSQTPWQGSEQPGVPPTGRRYTEYSPFYMSYADPLGGVPKNAVIEGVEASDLAAVVGPNAHHYLPKFFSMVSQGYRNLWNWAAFLLTPYWLLFRKQYLAGGSVLTLWVVLQTVQNYALRLLTTKIGPVATVDELYAGIQREVIAMLQGDFTGPVTILLLIFIARSLVRIICGLVGNRLYMTSCVKRVHQLKARDPSGYKARLAHTGGASFTLAMLAVWLMQLARYLDFLN